MSLTTQDLWAIYANQIATAAGLPSNPNNFILTGNGMVANFAVGSSALPSVPTKGEALFEVYNLADGEVNQQGIYHPANSNFFNDYATYIDNLTPQGAAPPTPTQTAQMKLIESKLATANKKWNSDLAAADAAWQTQSKLFPGKYPTFQSFLNQTPYGATVNNDMNNVTGLNSQLSTLKSKIFGKSYVAIQTNKTVVDGVRAARNGSTVTGPADMKVTATSGDLIVPTYNPSDLNVFSSWVDGIIAQGPSNLPICTTFDTSSAKFDFSKSQYFSQTNWHADLFFFSVGGHSSQSRTQVNIDTSSSQFSLKMCFGGITQVALTRGPWYDSSLMYAYKNPDNLATPVTLYVAMYPTITLTMDAQSYQSAYSSYNSSHGFGVGAWWVAAGGHSSSSSQVQMSAKWDATSRTVTISPNSVQPVIVGMEVTQV